MCSRKAFTLIELLVVIAIIAILAVVVVLTLNPAQLLAQSRDANRVSDMATLNSAIGLYQTDQSGLGSMGSSSIAYVSLPDSSSTCGTWGLAPGSDCVPIASIRNIDGTGWIPLNFNNISSGAALGSLPLDPSNSSSSGLFYTYSTTGSQFELIAPMESAKYRQSIAGALGPGIATAGSGAGTPPVGYWAFDEGAGTTAYDTSGNGGNATLSNSATYGTGKVGQYAVMFPGTVQVPNSNTASSPLNINSVISLAFWIKDYGTTYAYPNIVYKIGSGTSGYGVQRQNTSTNLYARIDTSGGINQNSGNINSVLDGNWHHIVFILNNGVAFRYKDGALVGTSTYIIGNGFAAPTSTFSMGSPLCNCFLDDVRIYNRPLSAAEIQALYNAEH